MADATGWLIERTPDGFAEWLTLEFGDTLWTRNANEALRFAREIDARRYVDCHVSDMVRVTEHAWLDDPRRERPKQATAPEGK